MSFPSVDHFRRLVLQWIQPLESGNIDSIDDKGFNAKATNLPGYGDSDQLMHTYPYGIVASPIKGTVAYVMNLLGSLAAPIIVTHLDKLRPKPSTSGEMILYCLNEDGSMIPIQVTFKTDGTLVMAPTTKTLIGSDSSDEPLVLGNVALDMLGQIFSQLDTLSSQLTTFATAVGTPPVGLITSPAPGSPVVTSPALIAASVAAAAAFTGVQTSLTLIKTQFVDTGASNIVSQLAFTERGPP